MGVAIRADVTFRHLKERDYMNAKKVLGFAAVGAFLAIAVPAPQAQALSLSNPGAAAAVQSELKRETTEVRWHRHWGHRGWHRHHRWHRHRWHHRRW
jgi:hypothetical protein